VDARRSEQSAEGNADGVRRWPTPPRFHHRVPKSELHPEDRLQIWMEVHDIFVGNHVGVVGCL